MKKKLLQMSPSSSSHKASAITLALLFLLLSTGFCRKLKRSSTIGDGFQHPSSLIQEIGGKSREMMELDYEDAGPNTNKRSGNLINPDPDAQAPASQP